MKKILFISGNFKGAISRGSDYRLHYLLESLLGEFEVTWFSIPEKNDKIFFEDHLNLRIIRGENVYKKSNYFLDKLYYFFGNIYPEENKMINTLVEDLTKKNLKDEFDFVFLFYLAKYKFVSLIRQKFPSAKIAIDINDIQFERYKIIEKNRSRVRYWLKFIFFTRYRIDEIKALRITDLIVTLSLNDQLKINKLLPNNKAVLAPIGVDIIGNNFQRQVPPHSILFLGALDISPNIEALSYFIDHLLIRIQEECSNVELIIAGSNPTKEILNLSSKNIKVLGFVENLQDTFKSSRLLIFPHRLPYGSRVKVMEAMANGVPTVIFKESIQGMGIENVTGVSSVSSDDEFIDMTLKLLLNDEFWAFSSKGAYEYSKNNCSNKIVYSKMLNEMKSL
jgi:glycosyltransferase involved in cell wall biosynthesis